MSELALQVPKSDFVVALDGGPDAGSTVVVGGYGQVPDAGLGGMLALDDRQSEPEVPTGQVSGGRPADGPALVRRHRRRGLDALLEVQLQPVNNKMVSMIGLYCMLKYPGAMSKRSD